MNFDKCWESSLRRLGCLYSSRKCQFESNGAVDSPSREDSFLLLDGRQLCEGRLGQVFEEGELHPVGPHVSAPGVGGGVLTYCYV